MFTHDRGVGKKGFWGLKVSVRIKPSNSRRYVSAASHLLYGLMFILLFPSFAYTSV